MLTFVLSTNEIYLIMSHFNPERYKPAFNYAKSFFANNRKVRSASLGEIYFNSSGFRHLIWKLENVHKRDWKNQIKRFELLKYIKPVLERMGFYQEYCEEMKNLTIEDHGINRVVNKKVTYWGFIAIINDRIRIKIILRKIGDGNIIFWSVIPCWKTKEYKGIKYVTLYKGNPSED